MRVRDFFLFNGEKVFYDYEQYGSFTSLIREISKNQIVIAVNEKLKERAKANAYMVKLRKENPL